MGKLYLGLLASLLFFGNTFGTAIEVSYMAIGPIPMTSVEHNIGSVTPQSAIMLSNVLTSSWTYGCANTAAGMMFGYYDRVGYSNMYTGTTNGGMAPLADLGNQCSLIATCKGFDGRNTYGHVDDYWVSFNSSSPDPWQNNRTEHVWGDCVSDFMGSNQLKWDYIGDDGVKDYCSDGTTALFSYNGPQKLYDYTPSSIYGLPQTELCHGLKLIHGIKRIWRFRKLHTENRYSI